MNQDIKSDHGKEQLTLVPLRIIHDIAAVRMFGVQKYKDPENWRKVEAERYRNALFRHFLKYLDDPYGVDDESGLPHLWHIATNVAFLCELEDKKTGAKLVQVKSHGDKIMTETISVDIGDTAECFKKT